MGNRLAMRACGRGCGARVASAVYDRTGLRGEIELAPPGKGQLAIVLELPGLSDEAAPLRVVASLTGKWRQHFCPKASQLGGSSYSAVNFNRKRRDP